MDIGTKSETSFRTASLEDIAALRRFEQEIVSTERAFDPTLKAGRIQYYDVERMLTADNVKVVVAERGDLLVGCGFAQIDDAKEYFRHSQQAYLGLMYVDPKYRGQSINGVIVEHLKAWCRSRGVTELHLVVYSDNQVAVRSYERAGFSKYVTEMRIHLDDR